jgi:hypothetical protein
VRRHKVRSLRGHRQTGEALCRERWACGWVSGLHMCSRVM